MLNVLGLDRCIHSHLAVGHAYLSGPSGSFHLNSFSVYQPQKLLRTYHFSLIDVALLQFTSSCRSVVIGEDAVDGSLGSVALSVAEFTTWKHNWPIFNDTEGDSCVVGSAELILIARIHGARLERHLVQFLEIARVLRLHVRLGV